MKLDNVLFSGVQYPGPASVSANGLETVYDLTDKHGRQIPSKCGIARIEFNDNQGEFIDGFSVTYRYIDKDGTIVTPDKDEDQIIHGTFNEDEVHHKVVNLAPNEYICAAKVVYVNKDTDNEYIGRITLWANKPGSKRAYQAGDWGETPAGEGEEVTWHWENKDGHLFSFAARQRNNDKSMGLKELGFGEHRGNYAIAPSAAYPAYDAAAKDNLSFDDFKKYGVTIDMEHPIKRVEVWSDRIVEGIRVTYNLLGDRKPISVMHGSRLTNIAPVKIELNEHESIVEVTGIHGEACPDTQWGDRINLLDFKIYNAKVGMFRHSGTCGKFQEGFKQNTRKDICVRGPLVAIAGRSDDLITRNQGLYNLKFFTRVPPWKGAGGKLVSGATADSAASKAVATNGTTDSAHPPTSTEKKLIPLNLPSFNPLASVTPSTPVAAIVSGEPAHSG